MDASRKGRLSKVYDAISGAPQGEREVLLRCLENGFVLPDTGNAVEEAYNLLQNLSDKDIGRIVSFLRGKVRIKQTANPEKEAHDIMDSLGYKRTIYAGALSHYKTPGEKGSMRKIVDGAYPGLFSELKEKGLVTGQGIKISLTQTGERLLELLEANGRYAKP